MITITPEIRKAIEMAGDRPLQVVDPETHATYVLISIDQFERLNAAADAEGLKEMYGAIEAIFAREGWDDPSMDVYDDYDANRP